MPNFNPLILPLFLTLASAATAQTTVPVFTTDFATQSWIAIDTNADGLTWTPANHRYAYRGLAATGGADDCIVSPLFDVNPGSDYKVTVRLKQTTAFDADCVEVLYGAAPDALTHSIGQGQVYETNGCGAVAGSFRLCPADANVCVGVRVTAGKPNGILALKDITVTPLDPATPQPVTALKVVADPLTKTVKMTWRNPALDTESLGIVQPLAVNIYENGSLIATLTERESGQKDTYTHSPATWSGEAEYRITALIAASESEGERATVNLEDNTGEETLVASFAQFTKDEFNTNWYIENNVGAAAWKWGYKNTALFDYPSSTAQDDWLITPRAALEKGRRYIVRYKMQTSEKYSATLYVTVGNAQSPQAQTTVIQEHIALLQNGMRQFESRQFTVDEDGDCYVGFHVTEAEVGVHLQAVEIYEVKVAEGTAGEDGDEDDGQEAPEYNPFSSDIDDDTCEAQFSVFDPQSNAHLGTEGLDLIMAANYAMLDRTTGTLLKEGFYRLTHDEAYVPNPAKTLRKAYVAGGACCHDGIVYANEFSDQAQVDKQEPMWRIYDAATMTLKEEHKLPDFCRATTSALTYNVADDRIYGFNYTYTETYLVRVDPLTGDMQRVGDFYDRNLKFLAIASRKDGALFCIYMNKNTSTHYLARVSADDGRLANLGVLVCGGYMENDGFVDGGYLQCMWFCNANDKLYWLHQSASENVSGEDYTPIMEVDVETCSASLAAYLPRLYVTGGVNFIEPRFTAPAAVRSFSWQPANDNHTLGCLELQAPETDYIGRPLSGEMTLRVLDVTDPDDVNELWAVKAKPGETVRSEQMTFSEGTIKVEVFAVNDDSEEGLRLRRSFHAGYDQLKAPANIRLTADGLTTTLVWDEPTEGVNGHVVSLEGITYKVVRYPKMTTVAENLTERQLVEEHPAALTRYVYAVTAIDKDGKAGQQAFSNNLIVGEPLTVPFGGPFTCAADLFNFYTIVDANGDSHTWTFDTGTQQAIYVYNELQAADDWLISPPAIYEEGKEYELTFTARSSMTDYPEDFEVLWGDGRTPDNCQELLLSVTGTPSETTAYSVRLPQIPATGVYHFAIRCTSAAYREYLFINNICVSELEDNDAVTTPTAAPTPRRDYFTPSGQQLSTPRPGVIVIVNDRKIITK